MLILCIYSIPQTFVFSRSDRRKWIFLSLSVFPIYDDKGISVFLEVVCPWHAMLYKTIDVPLVHLYCCDAPCKVRTVQVAIFMRIKFCRVWCNHGNSVCVKHLIDFILVKTKAVCHIQFSCVTISIQEILTFMCKHIVKIIVACPAVFLNTFHVAVVSITLSVIDMTVSANRYHCSA